MITRYRLRKPQHIAFGVYKIKTLCGKYCSKPYLTRRLPDYEFQSDELVNCTECIEEVENK